MPFSKSHQAPKPLKIPQILEQLGVKREDNYYWMKDENWRAVMRDPKLLRQDIREHLEAENVYTQAVLSEQQSLSDALFEEMKGRLNPKEAEVPTPDGDYAYFHKYRDGDQHGVYVRFPISGQNRERTGEDSMLLDADELAKQASGYFDIGTVSHSANHKRMAYSVDMQGSENYEIFVGPAGGPYISSNIKTSTGSVVWAEDNRSIVWVERDDNQRPCKVYVMDMQSSKAEPSLIYQEHDPGFFVSVGLSDSQGFLIISSHNHTTTELHLVASHTPLEPLKCFKARKDGLEYSVHELGGYAYILTNADGAKDFKIMRRPLSEPDSFWEPYIDAQPETLILGIETYKNYLVRLVRQNALPRIIIRDMSTEKEHEIAFDEDAYGLGLVGGYEYDTDWMRFVYSSPTTPRQIFDYRMDTRERVLRDTQIVPSGHDTDMYTTERIHITARDGEEIPVTLLMRRDTRKDGQRPVLLYGYGSYGITIPAGFRTTPLSLVDRGFIFAIAHVRGGMAKGYQWYLDGKLDKKINTFNDFVDVGRGLVEQRYTSRGKIVAHGGSAGGMLVGAALNQDPNLFAGVIAAVPFVDVLNTMSDADLPLTPPEWPEWGNPLEDKDAYARILAYSPYDNVVIADYPPVFVTGGLTDPRVTYWEPAKWAAKLREHQTSDNPILLKINMEAGHQGEAGRYDSLKETALEYAFALSCVGLVQ